MPPILADQIFPSLAAFKDTLRQWAVERNWTPHILDSDSHRVRAGCRSSADCPFRIRANYSEKKGEAKVTTLQDVHTCAPFQNPEGLPAHQDIKRPETGKLKFLVETVPKLMLISPETNIQDIIAIVERTYGQKIPLRQAQKVKGALVTKRKGPCRQCHQVGHTRRFCPRLEPGPVQPRAKGAGNAPVVFQPGSRGGGSSTAFRAASTLPARLQQVESSQHDQGMSWDRAPLVDRVSATQLIDMSDVNLNLDPSLSSTIPQTTPVRQHTGNYHAVMQSGRGLQMPNTLPVMLPAPTPSIGVSSVPRASSRPQAAGTPAVQMRPQNEPVAMVQSPSESRAEASRLMQQAALLMAQASKLQMEASRLATIADVAP